MLYHGTTWKFDSFDIGKSKELNFIGDGIYLTTSEEDAHKNYACVGPDLKDRIDNMREDISNYDENPELNTEEEIIRHVANEMIGEYSLVLECELKEETKTLIIDKNNPVYFDLHKSVFDGEDFSFETTEDFEKIINIFECLGIDYSDSDFVDKFYDEITAYSIYEYCTNFFGTKENQNLFAEIVCALGYDAVRFVNIGDFLYMYRKQNHDHIIVFNKDCIRILEVHDNEVNTRLEYLKEQNACVSC